MKKYQLNQDGTLTETKAHETLSANSKTEAVQALLARLYIMINDPPRLTQSGVNAWQFAYHSIQGVEIHSGRHGRHHAICISGKVATGIHQVEPEDASFAYYEENP